MLAIGRALMGRPSLLMLDEPSLGLAPIVIEQVFDRIVELNKRTRLGVLLVEQNSAMALEIASRAFVLETGAITLSGPSAMLEHDAIRCVHSLSFGNSWRIRRVKMLRGFGLLRRRWLRGSARQPCAASA